MRIQASSDLGSYVRRVRKAVGMTQKDLAGVCGVGVRFINELENGKATCELGRALHVIAMLGITVELTAPHSVLEPENRAS